MNTSKETKKDANTNYQNHQDHEDYILKDNNKTKLGAGFIITVLILLLIAVGVSIYYFEWL
ncbi:hypothetical protein INR76_10970 [Marixanthomonas sp. SCSIO 43207]|uniref:hypothetical protein n=1 Tax=Marixanthomonas sp. SCSIO 43207 TaxID=2779360 RepID=UPI001CA8FD0E|nr:hypothetical protein [Marixanthomonas sp. SCSIO 43207]UAB80633.1 hypothetical protein INR76_10970 [Marixanthomonas sp. SCSIO 43207]